MPSLATKMNIMLNNYMYASRSPWNLASADTWYITCWKGKEKNDQQLILQTKISSNDSHSHFQITLFITGKSQFKKQVRTEWIVSKNLAIDNKKGM